MNRPHQIQRTLKDKSSRSGERQSSEKVQQTQAHTHIRYSLTRNANWKTLTQTKTFELATLCIRNGTKMTTNKIHTPHLSTSLRGWPCIISLLFLSSSHFFLGDVLCLRCVSLSLFASVGRIFFRNVLFCCCCVPIFFFETFLAAVKLCMTWMYAMLRCDMHSLQRKYSQKRVREKEVCIFWKGKK